MAMFRLTRGETKSGLWCVELYVGGVRFEKIVKDEIESVRAMEEVRGSLERVGVEFKDVETE